MEKVNQNEEKSFIRIPNKFVQNHCNEIGDNVDSYIYTYGKRIVCYIMKLIELETKKKEVYFTIDGLIDIAQIDLVIRKAREEIKDVLNIMQIEGIILSDIDFSDKSNIKSTDFIKIKLNISHEDGFFLLYEDDYNKIMSCDTILDKYNLLNLFCNISSRIYRVNEEIDKNITLDYRREVAYPSYEKIMDDININYKKSLQQYIDKLVELDLIRFDNAGDKFRVNRSGKLIRSMSNNTYILYSNSNWEQELKEAIRIYKKAEKLKGWEFLSKDREITSNERRSITQKINVLNKLKESGAITKKQEKELNKLISTKEGIDELIEFKKLPNTYGKEKMDIEHDLNDEPIDDEEDFFHGTYSKYIHHDSKEEKVYKLDEEDYEEFYNVFPEYEED